MPQTTVFISYAWNDDEHADFVGKLADRLEIEPDLTVTFDEYDVTPAVELTRFMETGMRNDRVVFICEPFYKTRADERLRGVGFETRLGAAEILDRNPDRKFIPVLRGDDPAASIPDFLRGITYVDLRPGRDFETGMRQLLAAIRHQPTRARPAKNPIPTETHAPSGTAPRRPPLFIGRDDDVAVLTRRILDPATPVTVVRGWPGVGKSTVVAAIAHDPEIVREFPLVLWTFVGDRADPGRELLAWLRYLEPGSAADGAPAAELATHLARLLTSRRVLLLIDDLWREEDAAYFRVGGARSHTILTTRGIELAHRLAPATSDVYALPLLTLEHSLELLERIAPQVVAGHRAASRRLAEELEGLPLAIRVAGHLLGAEAARGLSVEKLIDELREGRALLLAQAPDPGLAEFVPTTVTALLRRTTDRLTAEDRERFARLGPFAPKPATFPLSILEKIWNVSDAIPTVRALVDRGLLEPAGEGRFQMHALLVRHANDLLDEL